MTRYTFPPGFLWGSSTSGPQTEGRLPHDGKGDNVWDYWYQIEPNRFRESPETTSTFYQNWESDLELLLATGQTAFRTSIQWSRIFPEGDGAVNPEGVAFYKKVFKKVKALGLTLFVNLYHFDLPASLQQRFEGWKARQTVLAYERYARFCFETFGSDVDYWLTFNEPIVPVEFGYFHDAHYPRQVDPKGAVAVAFHTQLASALAIQACHQLNPEAQIGIVLNLTPAYPRSSHPADVKAATIAGLFQARSFLDPSVLGTYPEELVALLRQDGLLPAGGEGFLAHLESDMEILAANTVDFLGINYYQPLRVAAPRYAPHPDSPWMPERYYEPYDMPGKKVNPYRGWEIYPQGLYDLAMNLQTDYGSIPWFLMENGMGVENEGRFRVEGRIQDTYRIDFIKDHLKDLHHAIEDGAPCQGYFVWTFIDCWSWLNGYKNRYGLVELDLESQERRLKESGIWFKDLARQNGFEE